LLFASSSSLNDTHHYDLWSATGVIATGYVVVVEVTSTITTRPLSRLCGLAVHYFG